MIDRAERLNDTIRRMRDAANIQPPPSAVCVLVAPPLGRTRVWAAFRLPAAWLQAVGWDCDFLACHRARWSYSKYKQRMGMPSRTAYQRLVRSGARVTARVRWRDLERAVLDPNVRAIILIGHHAKDGVELLDGVTPTHVLMALLEARNAIAPFPFAWLMCSAQERETAIISVAPDVLPFSAPMRLELPAAIESAAAWIEGLNGETPFDLAQQRAFARQFPSERPREPREPRAPRDSRDQPDPRGPRNPRDSRDSRDSRDPS